MLSFSFRDVSLSFMFSVDVFGMGWHILKMNVCTDNHQGL